MQHMLGVSLGLTNFLTAVRWLGPPPQALCCTACAARPCWAGCRAWWA